MMRSAGLSVDDKLARKWLAPFASAAPHPLAFRQEITAQPPHDHRADRAQPPHDHGISTAPVGAVEVSLPTKPFLTGEDSAEPLTLVTLPAQEPAKPAPAKKPRKAPITAADLEAYRLLDGLWSRISPHLTPGAYTAATWKRNHKRIALEMLEGGVPIEDWFAFWDECANAERPYRVLKNFQAGFANRRGHQHAPVEQNASDALPTITDLIAAGKLDGDAISRETLANRPAWFTPVTAEA